MNEFDKSPWSGYRNKVCPEWIYYPSTTAPVNKVGSLSGKKEAPYDPDECESYPFNPDEEYNNNYEDIYDELFPDEDDKQMVSFSDEEENVPAVVHDILKDSMKHNLPFYYTVFCPYEAGNSLVIKELHNLISPKILSGLDCDEPCFIGPLVLFNCYNDMKYPYEMGACAETESLEKGLVQMVHIMHDEGVNSLAIPYLTLYDIDNYKHFTWDTTMNFIIGVLEREVNLIRINSDEPNFNIHLTFCENY